MLSIDSIGFESPQHERTILTMIELKGLYGEIGDPWRSMALVRNPADWRHFAKQYDVAVAP